MVAATLLIFAIPLLAGADLLATLLRAMTFMIFASPCAVVLAAMPPLLSAMTNAGRHGVLVKSAVVMERLGPADGRTAVVVTVDGRPAGVPGMADRLRPEAATATGAFVACDAERQRQVLVGLSGLRLLADGAWRRARPEGGG